MAFWWVNHKQTRDHEVRGGYLWSPMRNANGVRNQTYENMRMARPGDIVFSYANGRIGAIRRVTVAATACPKPDEFGNVGDYWSDDGWMVEVDFRPAPRPLSLTTLCQKVDSDPYFSHGLSISAPTPEEQDALHQIIFDQLVKGRVEAASRERFITIMRRMHTAGAQAVILGCTEFGMLLRAGDAPDIPRVDTTELHCQAAVGWMLAEDSGHEDAT